MEGEVDVAPGRCVASLGGRGSEQRGRRWRRVRACGGHTLCLLAREEDDRRRQVDWASELG